MNAQINLLDEIIVDNFAGGGGASTGIELAAGRPVTIAINHDPAAILMHKTNHPHTLHLQASVWDVDPEEVCAAGRWAWPGSARIASISPRPRAAPWWTGISEGLRGSCCAGRGRFAPG